MTMRAYGRLKYEAPLSAVAIATFALIPTLLLRERCIPGIAILFKLVQDAVLRTGRQIVTLVIRDRQRSQILKCLA
jgi:hypothetical protein